MNPGSEHSGFAAVLRAPQALRILVTSALAATGVMSRPLAVLLFVRSQTHSFATAGLVVAALTIGLAVSSPVRGRALDRHGYLPGLAALVGTSFGAALGLDLCSRFTHPTAAFIVCAGVMGATTPPVSATLRSVWAPVLGDSAELKAAYATTTMVNELSFLCGPLLTAGVVALASPSVAVLASSGAMLAGTLAFAANRAVRQLRRERGTRLHVTPLRAPGVQTMLIAEVTFSASVGVLDVGLPVLATARGSSALGGVLLAAVSVGVLCGAYLYGRASLEGRTPTQLYGPTCLLAAIALVPLVFTRSIPAAAAFAVIAGACSAPFLTCHWALVDVVAPPGRAVETTSWLISASMAGAALGTSSAGAAAESASVSVALSIGVAAALLASVLIFARKRTLGPFRGSADRDVPSARPLSHQASEARERPSSAD